MGGAVAPFVMGFLADALSFDAAFLFLELGLVVALGAVLWAPQRPEDLLKHFPELRNAGPTASS